MPASVIVKVVACGACFGKEASDDDQKTSTRSGHSTPSPLQDLLNWLSVRSLNGGSADLGICVFPGLLLGRLTKKAACSSLLGIGLGLQTWKKQKEANQVFAHQVSRWHIDPQEPTLCK